MRVLLFDSSYQCFASLSPKHVTESLLKSVKALQGSFLHCPVELVPLLSGKDDRKTLDNILKDLQNIGKGKIS